MGKGLTKLLKENKKLLWPYFPIRCGSFSLTNFNHAIKESISLESLRLHTMPKMQFDLNKIAYNITIVVKIKPYNHEANDFEDLLQSAESFKQSFEWARKNLSPEYFESFQEFRNKKPKIIMLHLLKIEDKPTPSVTVNGEGPNSHIKSQVDTRKALDTRKAQDSENIAKSSRKSSKKQGMSTPPKDISSETKSNSLEQEWDQFNKKLQDAQENMEYQTPVHLQKNTESESMDEQATMSQQTEIIPTLPTS